MNLIRWICFIILAAMLAACITTPDEVVIAPIHVALTSGNSAEVQRIASDQDQLTALNEYNETPLLYAVKRRKSEMVEILLGKGAKPNTGNPSSGETPLIAAVKNGDASMVSILLKAGASLEIADNEGTTPLLWAVRKGDLKLVKALTSEQGPDKIKGDPSFVLESAAYGHREILSYFLSMGAALAVRSDRGETPLILAARFGHGDVVRLLLEKGSEVSAVDTDGASSLMWASRMGRQDVVPLLVEAGPGVDLKDSGNLTPLSHAVRLGHLQVVKYLLSKGADANFTMETGESLIFWAGFQEGIARELSSYGAEPQRVSDDTGQPVLIASRYLWLAKFYEGELQAGSGQNERNHQNMLRCYGWAAEFFDMAAVFYDESVKARRKKQAAADRMAFFLSVLSISNAQMQAQFQANQMAELSALGNPGSPGMGYGYASYYTPAAFKKDFTGGIPELKEAAQMCRLSAKGCREVLECYRSKDSASERVRSCVEKGHLKIQHLK